MSLGNMHLGVRGLWNEEKMKWQRVITRAVKFQPKLLTFPTLASISTSETTT